MLLRVFRLYCLSLKAFFQRLRYDLAKEVVVIICALIIFATFLYVFNDFLNVEVKNLSERMRLAFAQASSWVLLTAATWASLRTCRSERFAPTGFRHTALRLGENPKAVSIFLWLRILTICALFYGTAWYFIFNYMVAFDSLFATFVQISLLIAILLLQMLPQSKIDREAKAGKNLSQSLKMKTTPWTMAFWRLRQILFRNRLTQICLVLATAFTCVAILMMLNGAPLFALVFASLVTGIFASISLAFQLQDDLNYAWAERSMGVSHNDFIEAYFKIGALIGAALGSVILLTYILHQIVLRQPTNLTLFSNALKLCVCVMIPSLILPSLMLQIDGRKPAIQVILVILVGTFIATAVFAHWLGLIVLVLAIYYGNNIQTGRFYRA